MHAFSSYKSQRRDRTQERGEVLKRRTDARREEEEKKKKQREKKKKTERGTEEIGKRKNLREKEKGERDKEQMKHKEAQAERRRWKKKIRRNRSKVLHKPSPIFLFPTTSSTANTSSTSTKPLQRGKNTVDSWNKKKQRKKIVQQSIGEKKENQCLPPQPAAAITMPPWATSTMNDNTSIPGNSLPLVFVSHCIFLHAKRVLCTFLQYKKNNYPVTVHEHSNQVIVFGLVTMHRHSNQLGLDPQSSPARLRKKIFFKNYFKKSMILCNLFYWILLSFGLYFYIVKIQI